jgi:hypothetical protein
MTAGREKEGKKRGQERRLCSPLLWRGAGGEVSTKPYFHLIFPNKTTLVASTYKENINNNLITLLK